MTRTRTTQQSDFSEVVSQLGFAMLAYCPYGIWSANNLLVAYEFHQVESKKQGTLVYQANAHHWDSTAQVAIDIDGEVGEETPITAARYRMSNTDQWVEVVAPVREESIHSAG